MAVRTRQAGVKNKRDVGVRSAQPSQGTTRGKKTLPRDEAAAYKRDKNLERMTPGPGATETKAKRGRSGSAVRGRKKAPSQIAVKRRGGPFKKSRLHGG